MTSAGESRLRTVLLMAAVTVLAAGSVCWVFPHKAAALLGSWALPALSFSGLILAFALATEWRWLRAIALVLGITLVVGWQRVSATSTSHFAGACLGILLMVSIGRAISTARQLRFAMLAFLSSGLAVLLLGLAGSSVRVGTWFDAMLPFTLPPIKLGLAGVSSGVGPGDVNGNALAAAALLIVPLGATVLFVRSKERADWRTLLPMGFAVAAAGSVVLLVCRSRSAWLAAWLTMICLLARGTLSWRFRIGILLLVVAPAIVVGGGAQLMSREAFTDSAAAVWLGANDRAEIMTQGVARWRRSPWFGIGLNEFHVVARAKGLDPVAHAHNIFLQTLLDVGVIGAAAYWGLLAFLLVRADQAARGLSRLGRSAAIGSALALIAVTMFGLGDAVTLGSKVGMFQWISSGLILASWRLQAGTALDP